MSIVNYREILPRTFSHRFGESPTAERRFSATLTEPVAHQSILDAIGIKHGSGHPEYSYLLCTEGSVTETDRHHAEITYRYEVPQVGIEEFQENPIARPDVWSFTTGGVAVPAFVYYPQAGNSVVKTLVNTAGDFFEGVTTEESEIRCTIAGNRPTFPLALAADVTNSINSQPFLGGSSHTWKCAGIGGQQQVEVVNGSQVKYWSVSVELIYRQSGWKLQLPNVGWNYVQSGEKRRAWVWHDPPSGGVREAVPASTPQPLQADGSLQVANPGESNPPSILQRRVHRELPFATYFGQPPF